MQLLVASLWLLLLQGGDVARSHDDDRSDCSIPTWYPPASLAADVQLATGVDEMLASGQADEAVRRLRRAVSPTVLDDPGRYWDAPHELLRRGLGRALLKASPAICPDETVCRASALAQFVAAERIRRKVDPLRAFVPPDAIELRNDNSWKPPPDSYFQHLFDWIGLGSKAPKEHLQSIFDLPGRQGEVETFPAGTSPTVREFFTGYAPGSTTGFVRPQCREVVTKVCGKPWENCGHECMEQCCRRSLEALIRACLTRGNGKPFVLKGYSANWPAAALKDDASRLLDDYGTADKGGRGPPTRVEYEVGKKETRLGTAGEMPLSDFIAGYETQDWYNVGFPPGSMMDDVSLAQFLSCGGNKLISQSARNVLNGLSPLWHDCPAHWSLQCKPSEITPSFQPWLLLCLCTFTQAMWTNCRARSSGCRAAVPSRSSITMMLTT